MVRMEPRQVRIRRGELDRAQRWLERHVSEVCDKRGGVLVMTLETPAQRCSASMRATLHMWFQEIAQYMGDSAGAVKLWLKAEFLGEREVTIRGKTRMEPRSSEGLTKRDYLAFMDQVQAFAVSEGIPITVPSDEQRDHWRQEAENEQTRADGAEDESTGPVRGVSP